jgi:hypothetical protein
MRQVSHACALLLLTSVARAQHNGLEDFRVEVSGYAWIVDAHGTIQSGIVPIDLRRDLNIEQDQPRFYGKLVVKPARHHRLIVEGAPYRMDGAANLTRQITFAGSTYTVQDFVTSTASIDFVAAGYQYDAIVRTRGHLGFSAEGGYVNGSGTLTSRNFGFRASEQQSFGFPIAGAEGRVLPLLRSNLLQIEGEIKGMALGRYGHYLQMAVRGGIGIGRWLTLSAGYMRVDADVHRSDGTRGFSPTFQGSVVGLQLRYPTSH